MFSCTTTREYPISHVDVCIKHLVWHAARTVTQVSCLFHSFHDHYQHYSSQQYSHCYSFILGHCFCSLLYTSISRLLRTMAWLPLARFLLLRPYRLVLCPLPHSPCWIQTLTSWHPISTWLSRPT